MSFLPTPQKGYHLSDGDSIWTTTPAQRYPYQTQCDYPGRLIAGYTGISMRTASRSIRRKVTEPPGSWFGLRFGERGTHTSRTIMLTELSDLLKFTDPSSGTEVYQRAIVGDNLLGKRTLATRKLTYQRLSELYGLDPSVPLFRVLRRLWDFDYAGRSLLAFLAALARDPLLRMTTDVVLNETPGRTVLTADIDGGLEGRLGRRLNPSVRHKVARNAASSWTQSGHLHGRTTKRRSKPMVSPSATCFALLLGYATGLRGRALFTSEWARVLDTSYSELMQLVQSANRGGLLNYRQVGDVVEVQFPSLLRPYEEALCHG